MVSTMKTLIFIFLLATGVYSVGEECADEGKEKSEQTILTKIKEASYCNVQSDCVAVSFSCPFGCFNAINQLEKENLQLLMRVGVRFSICGGRQVSFGILLNSTASKALQSRVFLASFLNKCFLA